MFETPEQVYVENGIIYPLLSEHEAEKMLHLSDPLLIFSGKCQSLCGRPLQWAVVLTTEPIPTCTNCLARTLKP